MASICHKRLSKEIQKFKSDPLKNIYIDYDDNDITHMRCLIIGPEGTPYENGFYFIEMEFPDNYPHAPPKCTFMNQFTTKPYIRFNPNLYADGKICLSILGTWSGEPWSPNMNLKTVLLQIQTRMNENPMTNEPGYEGYSITDPQVKNYANLIWYYNLKYSTCYVLKNMNSKFQRYKCFSKIIYNYFKKNKGKYLKSIQYNMKLNNKKITTHYNMRDILYLNQLFDEIKNFK
tara:strand:- start:636 stop:1331 length:696 start_codon:yes stop_codon:yes gene_type:complete